MSIDTAHNRLAELGDDHEQLDEAAPLLVLRLLRRAVLEAAQVRAGREGAIAGAGQYDDPKRFLALAPAERRDEVAQHAGGKGIPLLRPVEGNRGDVSSGRHQHVLECWVLRQSCEQS